MRIRPIIFAIIFLFISAAAASAQQFITVTNGEFQRTNYNGDPFGGPSGTFRFIGPNSDVNGTLVGTTGGGVYTTCDLIAAPCRVGVRFTMYDNISGITSLRQNISPVTVNGTTYPIMFYNRSQLNFDSGTKTIPYYLAKRRRFSLTFKTHITGNLLGHSPTTVNHVFTAPIDMWGTVTVDFLRNDAFFPNFRYNITGVKYTFTAPEK